MYIYNLKRGSFSMDPQPQHGVDSGEKKATIQYTILHDVRIKRARPTSRKTCETEYIPSRGYTLIVNLYGGFGCGA